MLVWPGQYFKPRIKFDTCHELIRLQLSLIRIIKQFSGACPLQHNLWYASENGWMVCTCIVYFRRWMVQKNFQTPLRSLFLWWYYIGTLMTNKKSKYNSFLNRRHLSCNDLHMSLFWNKLQSSTQFCFPHGNTLFTIWIFLTQCEEFHSIAQPLFLSPCWCFAITHLSSMKVQWETSSKTTFHAAVLLKVVRTWWWAVGAAVCSRLLHDKEDKKKKAFTTRGVCLPSQHAHSFSPQQA